MAKQDTTAGALLNVALIGGGAYVLYSLALDNKLGLAAQQLAKQIEELFNLDIKGPVKPGDKDKPANRCSVEPKGNLAAMLAANVNIRQQIGEWQEARKANKENQYDWEAFRRHLSAFGTGTPDPGPYPPPEFCQ